MVASCHKVFSVAPTLLHTCVILLGVVFTAQCIGISSNYWCSSTWKYNGLWKRCSYDYDYIHYKYGPCICEDYPRESNAFENVFALEVTGQVFVFISGVMIFIQLFFTQTAVIKLFGILFMFLADICILAGVIVYIVHAAVNGIGFTYTLFPKLSFCLCTAAGHVSIICAILLVMDYKIAPRRQQASRLSTYQQQGIQVPRT